MVQKKIPMRKCTGCNEMKPKKELIRVVKTPEGEIHVDKTGKLNGRGAYICHKTECFTSAKKARRLDKAFEIQIPDEVYDLLEKELNNEE